MGPSLFNNEYSRGPLYQYWKERGQEEKALRGQRVEEAKVRSNGHQPLTSTYGPSSNDQYANRATSGPPTYRNDEGVSGLPGASDFAPASQPSDMLPSYGEASGRETEPEPALLSADEEKARLRQLEEQRRQIDDDAAIAQTLSRESAEGHNEGDVQGTGKQPARRKSTAGKVGRWLADAASGYTKKQERW